MEDKPTLCLQTVSLTPRAPGTPSAPRPPPLSREGGGPPLLGAPGRPWQPLSVSPALTHLGADVVSRGGCAPWRGHSRQRGEAWGVVPPCLKGQEAFPQKRRPVGAEGGRQGEGREAPKRLPVPVTAQGRVRLPLSHRDKGNILPLRWIPQGVRQQGRDSNRVPLCMDVGCCESMAL